MENVEVEVTLKLKDPQKLFSWLSKNATPLGKFYQVDVYFDHPQKSFQFTQADGFITANDYLRVRSTNKGSSLGFKSYHKELESEGSPYCDEIETEVNDPKKLSDLLKRLGFKESAVIDKTRVSYRYKDFQFDCDRVKNLGDFVEIEYKGKVADHKSCRQKIFELIKKIGLTDFEEDKRGYVAAMWNKGCKK